MGFRIKNESLSLARASFELPGEYFGRGLNPLERPAARLAKAVARAGWGVPGVDVSCYRTGTLDDARIRISSIWLQTPAGRWRIGFSNAAYPRQTPDIYAAASAEREDGMSVHFYGDGSGQRPPEAIACAVEAIEAEVARLEALPAARGHDDVTREGDANFRRLTQVAPKPAPADFPVLYAWAETDEIARMTATPDDGVEPADRSLRTGWRLLALGTRIPKGVAVHERANDGFIYASTDVAVRLRKPDWNASHDTLPVELRLKHVNDVYVMDMDAQENARRNAFEAAGRDGRDRLTDREVDAYQAAGAATMMAWEDYSGEYARPLYLIGRHIGPDEARIMRGPVKVTADESRVAVTLTDRESGSEIELMGSPNALPAWHGRAMRIAEDAARRLRVPLDAPPAAREGASTHTEALMEILESGPRP